MTDREKLIEIFGDLDCNAEYCKDCEFCTDIDGCVRRQKEIIADRLIANGVPFATDNNVGSKWIPVTERLPEVVDSYLVVVKAKYDYEDEYEIDVDVATYNPYEKAYIDDCWNTYNDWNEGQQYLHVTHWMSLPEPPKGE